jgi:hypothetical protein
MLGNQKNDEESERKVGSRSAESFKFGESTYHSSTQKLTLGGLVYPQRHESCALGLPVHKGAKSVSE